MKVLRWWAELGWTRALGVIGAVLFLAAVVMVFSASEKARDFRAAATANTAESAPPSAAAAPDPSATSTVDPAATETPDVTHDDEDVDTRPAEAAAVGFVHLYLADANVAPYVTEELRPKFINVSPERKLRKAFVTGPATVRTAQEHVVDVTVPTSAMEIAVTVEYDGTRWVVAGVAPA